MERGKHKPWNLMNRSRFFYLNTSSDSDHLLNSMDNWELICSRNKDAQSITTKEEAENLGIPALPSSSGHIIWWSGNIAKTSWLFVCLFFKENQITHYFFFFIHQTTKTYWNIGEEVCFNLEGCWSLLTGNWIQSLVLASTCQSLGELCWPCDNTWPPTCTETRKPVGGGALVGHMKACWC